MTSSGAARRSIVLPVALALLAACGADGDGDGDRITTPPETLAALTVCGRLRDFTNELVADANRTVDGINARTPAERTAAVLEGFDSGLEVAERHVSLVESLELPDDLPEREALLAELADGADQAVGAIVAERAAFAEEVPEITDDDVRGRVGQFFNAFEKAMSVTEPVIARYEREAFQTAFLEEPTCRHVVQQYRRDS